jgi:molybdopterin-guanine dinucleotide biosynthesis protein B
MPVVVSIVGSPDSGKTSLIEKIVPFLKKRGLKVAVVKHHAHGDFEYDVEGKDSWKHYNAGADVIISSPSKFALIRRTEELYSLDSVVSKYLNDYDLVLTEGFNLSGKPRVVVLNPGDDISRFERGEIIAVICSQKVRGYEEKTLRIEEWEKIAKMILSRTELLKTKSISGD